MDKSQLIISGLILLMVAMFILDKIRYDFVALGALMTGVLSGVIPTNHAFDGFSHPAVITVASVLVLSHTLSINGVSDLLAGVLERFSNNFTLFLFAVCTITATLSAFMNNVGALVLMMPVVVNCVNRMERSPSSVLMPLSFASILGGLTTLIGTPPNIIISSIRAKNFGTPFDMFSFAPVGLVIVTSGILFLGFIGWRIMPKKRSPSKALYDLLEIDTYVTELLISNGSVLIDMPYKKVKEMAQAENIEILGLIRQDRRQMLTSHHQPYHLGDVLIVEADAKNIDAFAQKNGLILKGSDEKPQVLDAQNLPQDHEYIEVVVNSNSPLAGQIVEDIKFNRRHGVNLLAVSRQGHPYKGRLKAFNIQVGDILLLEGSKERLSSLISSAQLMPLAYRNLNIRTRQKLWPSITVFSGSIGLAASGILPAPIVFTLAAVCMVLLKLLPKKEFYNAIEWPIIILLGSIIPISGAFETTGAAKFIVEHLLEVGHFPVEGTLIVIMVATMLLTDTMNNAATALIMAPIAISVSQRLEVNTDTFLMAVAIGASSAFLTPIGHQNNTLILGPGGYKFSDYWRLGLPLDIIIVAVAIPAILYFWPLYPN